MTSHPFDPRVSKFAHALTNAPEGDRQASAVCVFIASDKLKTAITAIRVKLATTYSELMALSDDERTTRYRAACPNKTAKNPAEIPLHLAKIAVTEMKKALPGVTLSGTCKERGNGKMEAHSGVIQADLDGIIEPGGDTAPLEDVRVRLAASPHCCFVAISPSGTGIKAGFRVAADASLHKRSVEAARLHVLKLTGLEMDAARSDYAGLMFMTHDPKCTWNGDAAEMLPAPEQNSATEGRADFRSGATAGAAPAELKRRARIADLILGDIEWQDDMTGFCQCPGISKHGAGDGPKDCMV
ncbi:MAG: BT4734/BF3469 family protein, partial [Chthoniobacteraceae bacterium]